MNFVIVTPARRLDGEPSVQGLSGSQPRTVSGTDPAAAEPNLRQDVFKTSASPKPSTLTGTDRRWSKRVSTANAGWIGATNLEAPVSCKVCNTSKHGALLEVDDAHALGRVTDKALATLTLVWLNNRIRSEANCTVRWRNKRLVGVSFIGPVRTMVERRG